MRLPSSRRLLVGALSSLAPLLLLAASVLAQDAAATELRAADSTLAMRLHGGLGVLASDAATADVVLLYPQAQVVGGRDAVRKLIDSAAVPVHERLAWSVIRADLSADGTRGYTYGHGTRTRRVGDGARDSTTRMRYVAWWRREDGRGPWRVAALLFLNAAGDDSTSAPWPCTTVTPSVTRRSSDAAHEVTATDSIFAARSAVVGAATAFAEFIANDGVSIGGAGAPACGKREIGAQFAGAEPSDLLWSPIVGDAAASGDLGYSVGTATAQTTHGLRYAKYLTIWKRQGDGAWRFVVDAGNAAPARLMSLVAR